MQTPSLEAVRADITSLKLDAIVNAANSTLLGGGSDCLPDLSFIRVGPVWQGGAAGEPALLASCYQRSLELAASKRLQHIAFPCISTGVYGFPADQAARIAMATV